MPEAGSGFGADGTTVPDGPPATRAAAWQALARHLVATGRPAPALLAAVTAADLWERVDEAAATTSCRALAGELSGTALTVLSVGAGAEAPGGTPDEARALWLGAPADPVLAMIGWVERGGSVHVVRVVVPGTARGRAAFRSLLRALPTDVAVSMDLPARDRELLKVVRRAGFGVTPEPVAAGDRVPGRYVGGTVRARR